MFESIIVPAQGLLPVEANAADMVSPDYPTPPPQKLAMTGPGASGSIITNPEIPFPPPQK